MKGVLIEDDWVLIFERYATLTIDKKTGMKCRKTQFYLAQASAVTLNKSQVASYTDVVYYAKSNIDESFAPVYLSEAHNGVGDACAVEIPIGLVIASTYVIPNTSCFDAETVLAETINYKLIRRL
ncbi:hypothetical protein HPB48_021124 [Haemaphysalis longicornis]|uniref:Uncharacterized protein n=1 Tax=Haemaphysalis longicornis TaxID=44386 RepID=A0A9J6FU50_HAELO|nr:hypothetical protein HPB48_021124 [Haemaphysalis longicornis]